MTAAPAAPKALVRVGTCELDTAAREFRRAGQPVALEPKVFDLLAYLMQHRERVVPKEELLRAVWPGQQVGEAALARAVMKARRAFGLPEGALEIIRTVPRVGYRFVSDTQEQDASSSAPVDVPAPKAVRRDAPLTVAVLPFENQTGDECLQWIEYGLMSLLAHALEHDPRLSPVSMLQVLSDVQAGELDLGDEEAVKLRTGAQLLVRTRVTRRGDDVCAEVELVTPQRRQGLSACAPDPVSIVGAVASMVLEAVFPGVPGTASTMELPADPMAAEAFARGLEAMAQHNFSQAVDLFRMALSLEPGLPALELGLLNALTEVGRVDEAEALAQRLADKAEQAGDHLLAARVNLALARLNISQRSCVAAGFRINAAMKLGEGLLTLDEQGKALCYLTELDLSQRDLDAAQLHAEQLEAHVQHSGNRGQLLTAYITRAIVAGCRENFELSAQLSEQGLREARALRVNSALIANALNASHALIELDRLGDAARHAEEAFAAATIARSPVLIGHAARDLGLIYRLVRAPKAIERVLAALSEFGEITRAARNTALCAQAHHAANIGDHAAAASQFQHAIAGMRQDQNALQEHETLPWLIASLVRAGRFSQAQAEIEAATQPDLATNARLQSHMLHCRALLEHACGQRQAALVLLQRLLSVPLSPLWRHWVLLDTAWLLAEDGSADEAQRLLSEVDPVHLAEQRIGWAVAARVAWAAGRREEAVRWSARYAAHRAVDPADFFASLAALYASDAPPGRLPMAPVLPSRC